VGPNVPEKCGGNHFILFSPPVYQSRQGRALTDWWVIRHQLIQFSGSVLFLFEPVQSHDLEVGKINFAVIVQIARDRVSQGRIGLTLRNIPNFGEIPVHKSGFLFHLGLCEKIGEMRSPAVTEVVRVHRFIYRCPELPEVLGFVFE